jgi:hypothetical protein
VPQGASENILQKPVARVDIAKDHVDKILSSFPPFFPIATYQKMNWMAEIKVPQSEVTVAGPQAAENMELPSFAAAEEMSGTAKKDTLQKEEFTQLFLNLK